MSYYADIISNLASGLQDTNNKLNIVLDRMNKLDGKTDPSISIEYADKQSVTTLTTRLGTTEQSLQDLNASISRLSITLKDDISKERSIIESAMQLKLEHYVTKCVKERLDLALQSYKTMYEDKLQKLQMQFRNDIESIKTQINAVAFSNVTATSQSQMPTDNVSQQIHNTTLNIEDIDINSLTSIPTPNDDDPLDIQVRKKHIRKGK
jgi:hypothetical protein